MAKSWKHTQTTRKAHAWAQLAIHGIAWDVMGVNGNAWFCLGFTGDNWAPQNMCSSFVLKVSEMISYSQSRWHVIFNLVYGGP